MYFINMFVFLVWVFIGVIGYFLVVNDKNGI